MSKGLPLVSCPWETLYHVIYPMKHVMLPTPSHPPRANRRLWKYYFPATAGGNNFSMATSCTDFVFYYNLALSEMNFYHQSVFFNFFKRFKKCFFSKINYKSTLNELHFKIIQVYVYLICMIGLSTCTWTTLCNQLCFTSSPCPRCCTTENSWKTKFCLTWNIVNAYLCYVNRKSRIP